MICQKCNASIPDRAAFCPACGGRVEAPAPVPQKKEIPFREDRTVRVRRAAPATEVNIPIPEEQDRTVRVRHAKPEPVTYTPPVEWKPEKPESVPGKPSYGINFISMILIVACLVAWALVPFMAVNNATLADQPTALELLLDDVDYVGELTDAMAYWMAIVAAGGLVLCLACTLLKSRVVTRVLAAVTLVPFGMAIVNVIQWAESVEEFIDFFGIAFWVVLVVLLAVLVLGGGWRKRK